MGDSLKVCEVCPNRKTIHYGPDRPFSKLKKGTGTVSAKLRKMQLESKAHATKL